MSTTLPLYTGARGDAVRDLQRRLRALGHDPDRDPAGVYGPGTEASVRRFQQERGLDPDGLCGRQTWAALEEAGHRLGDRLLYLTAPMLRGDDVLELQASLGSLGFDAGWVDGIFGPDTGRAVADFQRNIGLSGDGIFGLESRRALARLRGRTDAATTVAALREDERLRSGPTTLREQRVVITDEGGTAPLAEAIGRRLLHAGAAAIVVHDPDAAKSVRLANDFAASVVLGVRAHPVAPCAHRYFAGPTFESRGGRRLAEYLRDEIGAVLGPPGVIEGMRLALLRSTRMPAVASRLGPTVDVVRATPALADGFIRALDAWALAPIEP